MALDTALFVLGLDTVAQPRLVVSSDFQNGVSSINGVSKTVNDLWVQNLNWGTWTTADIIPGTGFVASKTDTSYYSPGPVATAAVNAAIGNEYTVVVDYTFATTNEDVDLAINFTATTLPLELSGWFWGTNQFPSNPSINKAFLGDFDAVSDVFPPLGFGSHKVAMTLSQARLMFCADGGTVNATTEALQANIPSSLMFSVDANTLNRGAGTTVTITIRKISIYSLVTDAVILQRLSV